MMQCKTTDQEDFRSFYIQQSCNEFQQYKDILIYNLDEKVYHSLDKETRKISRIAQATCFEGLLQKSIETRTHDIFLLRQANILIQLAKQEQEHRILFYFFNEDHMKMNVIYEQKMLFRAYMQQLDLLQAWTYEDRIFVTLSLTFDTTREETKYPWIFYIISFIRKEKMVCFECFYVIPENVMTLFSAETSSLSLWNKLHFYCCKKLNRYSLCMEDFIRLQDDVANQKLKAYLSSRYMNNATIWKFYYLSQDQWAHMVKIGKEWCILSSDKKFISLSFEPQFCINDFLLFCQVIDSLSKKKQQS
jgi:hypothetical protein